MSVVLGYQVRGNFLWLPQETDTATHPDDEAMRHREECNYSKEHTHWKWTVKWLASKLNIGCRARLHIKFRHQCGTLPTWGDALRRKRLSSTDHVGNIAPVRGLYVIWEMIWLISHIHRPTSANIAEKGCSTSWSLKVKKTGMWSEYSGTEDKTTEFQPSFIIRAQPSLSRLTETLVQS